MAKTKSKKEKIPQIPQLEYGQGTMVYREDLKSIQYTKTIKIKKHNISKRTTVYGKNVIECFNKMDEKEKKLNNEFHKKNNLILYDAMIDWLNKEKKPELKETSFDTLHKTVKRIGEYEISKIRYNQVAKENIENHIQELKDKNLSYSIVKKSYDALNAFYRYAVLNDMLEHNPVEKVKVPTKKECKPPKDIEWLNSSDIELFCNQAVTILPYSLKPQYQYGFCLCANIYMGLRVGELLALNWSDIDFKNGTVSITKQLQAIDNPDYDEDNPKEMKRLKINKQIFIIEHSTKTYQNRIIPLNDTAKYYISLQKKYSPFTKLNDFVCCTRDGKHAQPSYIKSCIGKIEKSADTECTYSGTHLIRHTCASLYYEKGVPTEIIASILGHSVEVCRTTYIHFENMRKAKESAKIVNSKLQENSKKQTQIGQINDLSNLRIAL